MPTYSALFELSLVIRLAGWLLIDSEGHLHVHISLVENFFKSQCQSQFDFLSVTYFGHHTYDKSSQLQCMPDQARNLLDSVQLRSLLFQNIFNSVRLSAVVQCNLSTSLRLIDSMMTSS